MEGSRKKPAPEMILNKYNGRRNRFVGALSLARRWFLAARKLQFGEIEIDFRQLGRQAADGHVLPAVEPDDREHLACDRSTREHEHLGVLRLEDALLVRTQ